MSPAPSPRQPATPADDFEWPPKGDGLAVYELGPDPWQTLQDASRDVFTARRRAPAAPPRDARVRESTQTRVWVLGASALVLAAAGWVLYGTLSRPVVVVTTVHHPAPPPAAAQAVAAAPERLTIFATYPAEPVSPRIATTTPLPSADGTLAAAPPIEGALVAPRVPIDSAPVMLGNTATDHVASEPTVPDVPGVAERTTNPPAPEPLTNDAGIRSLLRRYEDAYDRRDVRTAATLWPSLDQGALSRAFASLDRQDVHFDRCDIDATEARGSAVCVGTVRYVPSVGRAVEKEDRITWTFDLARSGEEWRIAGLDAR